MYIDFEPDVNDSDRTALGVPVWNRTPVQGFVPATIPEITVDTSTIRRLRFYFKDSGADTRGKPKGVHGLELRWAILDVAPTDTNELTSSEFDTSSPITVDYTEAERGKRVYYCGRWESRASKRGPWGNITLAVIS